jgi:putative ABC transport system permease protein
MLKSYFKIAWRTILRHKAYTAINVFGLSIGVACGILVFLLVRYHLSFDKYHQQADRIYRVVTQFNFDQTFYSPGIPRPIGEAIRNDLTALEKVALVDMLPAAQVTVRDSDQSATKKFKENEKVAFAEPAFFDIFDFTWKEGSQQTALHEPFTAVITEKYALKYFGEAAPIGKIFRLENAIDFKVTGILADLPENTDIKNEVYLSYSSFKTWAELLEMETDNWGSISSNTNCFVLLRPGYDVAQLKKELLPFKAKYLKEADKAYVYHLQPLEDIHFNNSYQGSKEAMIWVLVLIGAFLIGIACINFINLATAQAIKRSKEVGIRKVMGSNRWNLFSQFMLETATITFFAILVSLFLAELSLPFVNELFTASLELSLINDPGLLMALAVLQLVITLFAGAYPGMIISGFKPVDALKGRISSSQVGGMPVRRSLVVVQFVIAQVLIIGTIIVLSQLEYFKQADLGFQKEAVLLLPFPVQEATRMHTMKERMLKVAGVENVSFGFSPPFSGSRNTTNFSFDNRPEDEKYQINTKPGDHYYLDTYGLQLVAGRNLQASDTIREFLVNEKFVRKIGLGSAEEAIGKKLKVWGRSTPIVGVVKDFHSQNFEAEIDPVCIMSVVGGYSSCAVKVNLENIKEKIPVLEKIWTETFPENVFEYQFLDEHIAEYYEDEEIMLNMIRGFSIIAILISCLGLYGLVSFMAEQKTKEIGIRKVLGASVANILFLFSKEFAKLIFIAFLIAAPLAWWGMDQWLQNYVYRISITPWMFLLTIVIAASIAFVIISFKAIRAAIANPVKSLRTE